MQTLASQRYTLSYDGGGRVITVLERRSEHLSTLIHTNSNGRPAFLLWISEYERGLAFLRCRHLAVCRRLIHDANENVIRTMNAAGAITTAIYDLANRRIATINPLDFRTTLTHNFKGQQEVTSRAAKKSAMAPPRRRRRKEAAGKKGDRNTNRRSSTLIRVGVQLFFCGLAEMSAD